MQIEKGQRNIFRLTLTGYELAALISSAKWVAEGSNGKLTAEAVDNIKHVLNSYEKATKKLYNESSS